MTERECGLPANFTVYWPGREPLPMCDKHAAKAQGIGQAMGITIPITPADAGECSQFVPASTEEPAK